MRYLLLAIIMLLTLMGLAQENVAPALVSTEGTAVVYAAPDEILMGFQLISKDAVLKVARAENAEKSKAAISFLKSMGIAARHIQTQYVSIRPVTKHKSNVVDYFEARQSIQICIDDLTKYDAVVDGLIAVGVTVLNGPTFRNTEIRKYKDEARKKAIIAAKEKAQLLASTLGQRIGKAYKISEARYANNQRQNAYANFRSEESAEADISSEEAFAPGQLEVRASINVSFYLER